MTFGSIQNYLSFMSRWGSVNRSEKPVDRKELSNQPTPKSSTSKFSFARLLKCVTPLLLTSNALATSSLRGGSSSVQRRSLMQAYDLETCSPFSGSSALIDFTRVQCENTAGPDNCNQPELENFLKLVNTEVSRFLQPWECDGEDNSQQKKDLMNGDCNDILCKYVADGNLTITTNGTIPVPPSPTPDAETPVYQTIVLAVLLTSIFGFIHSTNKRKQNQEALQAIKSGSEIKYSPLKQKWFTCFNQNQKNFNLDIAKVVFLHGLLKRLEAYGNDEVAYSDLKNEFKELREFKDDGTGIGKSNQDLVLIADNTLEKCKDLAEFKGKITSKIQEEMQQINEKLGIGVDDFKMNFLHFVQAGASACVAYFKLPSPLGIASLVIGAQPFLLLLDSNNKVAESFKTFYAGKDSSLVRDDLNYTQLELTQLREYLNLQTRNVCDLLSGETQPDPYDAMGAVKFVLWISAIGVNLSGNEDSYLSLYLAFQVLEMLTPKLEVTEKLRLMTLQHDRDQRDKKSDSVQYSILPKNSDDNDDAIRGQLNNIVNGLKDIFNQQQEALKKLEALKQQEQSKNNSSADLSSVELIEK